MKVLFIGGTGVISSACSALAVERGVELSLLCRGKSPRPPPPAVHVLHGDIRDPASARAAIGDRRFDVVVQWVAFTPADIEIDLDLFAGRVGQYVFIGSASAYRKPPPSLPITESAPLHNPVWAYSAGKIACEERLARARRESGFPVTIVRPSHTYDRTLSPARGGWTTLERMRRGKKVIVPGDGTSLWVLTHHRDFAKGLVGLLGLDAAIGEAFHITSDEVLTWNEIHRALARAAGTEADLVHVPSDLIAAYDRRWGDSLLGDKAHSVIFDNDKIRRFVPSFRATIPFSQGAEEIVAWYDADPARRTIDEAFDRTVDRILDAYGRAFPSAAGER